MIKTTPMLFNSELVRALLAGNKTQTRRIMKPQPTLKDDGVHWWPSNIFQTMVTIDDPQDADCPMAFKAGEICPFGNVGDLIYVRETTLKVDEHGYEEPIYVVSHNGQAILEYGLAPSPDDPVEVEPYEIKKKPSIFMPRNHSRLTLKITDVRVERIQDISGEDAKKEGCSGGHGSIKGYMYSATPKEHFSHIWNSVYPDSYDKNEWVWVMDFEVIHKNVDLLLAEKEQAA
jgi:hypothetical protein